MELRLAGPAAELDLPLHIEHARTAHVGADRAEKTRRRHVPVEKRAATEQVMGSADRTERTRRHLPGAFALAFAAVATIAAASLGWRAVLSRRPPLRSRRRCAETSRSRPIRSSIPSSTGPTRAQRCLPEQISRLQSPRRPPPGVAPAEPSPTSTRGWLPPLLSAAAPDRNVLAGPPAATAGFRTRTLRRARRGGLMLRAAARDCDSRAADGHAPGAQTRLRHLRVRQFDRTGSAAADRERSAVGAPCSSTTTPAPASDAAEHDLILERDPHATSRCRRSRRRPSKRSRSLRRRCRHPDRSGGRAGARRADPPAST